MILQKQKSDYKRGYHKYVVVIPEKLVKKAKLKAGDKLKGEIEKHKLIFKKINLNL